MRPPLQNPARERERSYSKSSKREKELFKIQQHREKELFKIQQEREGGIQNPARERERSYSKSSKRASDGQRVCSALLTERERRRKALFVQEREWGAHCVHVSEEDERRGSVGGL